MKIAYLVVIVAVLLASLFAGCVTREDAEISQFAREFIKDYIKNPETIEYRNITVIPIIHHYTSENPDWNVYGVGTVEYEGSRKIFTYHVYVVDENGLKGVLKQVSIGD